MKRIVAALACLSLLAGCGVLGGRNRRPTTPTVGQRIPVLGTEGTVEADPLLAAIPVTVPAATANTDIPASSQIASRRVSTLVRRANRVSTVRWSPASTAV